PAGIYDEDELAVHYFNDDKPQLVARVARLDTGLAHAETPPSRTRHLITNVRVETDDAGTDEITVYSNFTLFQSRRERTETQFFGRREDRLRRVDGARKIAPRTIV